MIELAKAEVWYQNGYFPNFVRKEPIWKTKRYVKARAPSPDITVFRRRIRNKPGEKETVTELTSSCQEYKSVRMHRAL